VLEQKKLTEQPVVVAPEDESLIVPNHLQNLAS
jgi:hypothetical protein